MELDIHCLELTPVPFCLHGEIERHSSTVDLTFGPSLKFGVQPTESFLRTVSTNSLQTQARN